MDRDLPNQLAWRDWVKVLRLAGWELHRTQGGSARTFVANPSAGSHGVRRLATFHQPHGKATLSKSTLREYLRKIGMSREQFFDYYEDI